MSYVKRTRPMVIAHGGNSWDAPMNTIAAIKQAIELGVDLIEVDINLTADRVPVIFHGPSLHYTTNGEGSINEITIEQAKELDAGSWKSSKFAKEKIPTLEEALNLGKGKTRFALDLKTDDVEKIVETVQNAKMVDDVVLCGCDVSRSKEVRKFDKRLTILLNMDSELEQIATNDQDEFVKKYIDKASSAYLSALNVSYKYVNAEFIWKAHLRALPVWAWTVDNINEMKRLVELGVDAIYTNNPKQLLSVL